MGWWNINIKLVPAEMSMVVCTSAFPTLLGIWDLPNDNIFEKLTSNEKDIGRYLRQEAE